jgi:hypothetical protein
MLPFSLSLDMPEAISYRCEINTNPNPAISRRNTATASEAVSLPGLNQHFLK